MNEVARRVAAQLEMNPSVADLERYVETVTSTEAQGPGLGSSAELSGEAALLRAIVKWAKRPKLAEFGFESLTEEQWEIAYDLYYTKELGNVPRSPSALSRLSNGLGQGTRHHLVQFKAAIRISFIKGGSFDDRVESAATSFMSDRSLNPIYPDQLNYLKHKTLPRESMEAVLVYLGVKP